MKSLRGIMTAEKDRDRLKMWYFFCVVIVGILGRRIQFSFLCCVSKVWKCKGRGVIPYLIEHVMRWEIDIGHAIQINPFLLKITPWTKISWLLFCMANPHVFNTLDVHTPEILIFNCRQVKMYSDHAYNFTLLMS